MSFPFVRSFSALFALTFVAFFSVSFSEVPLASAVGCTWSKIAYVDSVGGSDLGPTVCHGTTTSNPYKSIAAALAARDYKYSGQSITIYYKGGSQSLNNTGFDNNVVLRPWGSSVTKARFTVSGPQTIKVTGFGFEASGGVTVNGTSSAVTVDGNTFTGGSAGVEISGASKVTVSNNLFDGAFVYAHDDTQTVTVTNNTFQGAAPYSYASETWFVVGSQLTKGFYFLTNRVSANSGNALYVENSKEVNLTANEVKGNGSDKAFFVHQSEGTYIDKNKVSNVQMGIVLSNSGAVGSASHFYAVSDNQIELTPGAGFSVPVVGIDIGAYQVENLTRNSVINGNHGFRIVNGSLVNSIEFNTAQTADHYSVDLEVEDALVQTVKNNLLVGQGTNIHFVDGTFTEIANNAIWSPFYGIILEHSDGDLLNWVNEQIRVENPGVLFTTAGSIHDNDFYKSKLGIGMASYGVKDIYSNRLREVHDGLIGYYSGVEKFQSNHLEHDVVTLSGEDGVVLYGSIWGDVSGNFFSNFVTALTLDGGSQILGNFSSNGLIGSSGLLLNNASIFGSVSNNVFAFTVSGLVTSGTVELHSIVNNTFYKHFTGGVSYYSLELVGTFVNPVAIVNNVFSTDAFSKAPIYLDNLSKVSVLDSNLYWDEGNPVLTIVTSDYTLAELQALSMELNGYEESISSLVSPATGDFHLSMNSLGVNSADPAYAPSVDFEGTARPVCTLPDRGADEISSSNTADNNDDDGDGLCNFQETAWTTDSLNSDTDGDLISDEDEIYMYRTTATSDDTDGDGYSDGGEILVDGTDPLDPLSHGADADYDGLSDVWETDHGFDPHSNDSDSDGVLDADEDGDSDGLTNLDEYNAGTDPAQADVDGDGLNDGEELAAGTDPVVADTDADGLPDGYEVDYGFDPLGLDSGDDSDGDGLTNLEEYAYGTLPNNEDTDGDTMNDGWEISYGLDVFVDDRASDLDLDGLTNLEEYVLGTYPNEIDSDTDLYTDFEEVTAGTLPMDAGSHPDDEDHDGMDDGWESSYGLDPSMNDAAFDLDGDGLTNLEEYTANMDPSDSDMDDDGLNDGLEVSLGSAFDNADTDSDGLPDAYEVQYGLELLVDDATLDLDGDGLTNLQEYDLASYPNDADTDSDGLPDAYEVQYGLELLMDDAALDLDGDGLTNLDEYGLGTYPNLEDSDGDGFGDGFEVTAGTSPTDPSDYPLDRDGDGLDDAWEASYVCMDASTADASTDDDLDGLSALQEYGFATNPCVLDTDGDGFGDGVEVTAGTLPNDAVDYPSDGDFDGLPDDWELLYSCVDSSTVDASDDDDVDGLSHLREYVLGTNPCVSDTDGDGLSDGTEVTISGTEPLVADSDADGLSDGVELNTYGTDPNSSDTDSDGLSDSDEIYVYFTEPTLSDTDGDGLDDGTELSGGTDPVASDTDTDGLTDGDELNTYGTDPLLVDSDSDGFSDYAEVITYGTDANDSSDYPHDADGDGLSDDWELLHSCVNPSAPDASGNTDLDGLTNLQEYILGTDPCLADTDSDGLTDGDEVNTYGTDALVSDTDADGLNDGSEVNTYGTDPLNVDMDSDGLSDGEEVNFYGTDVLNPDSDGDGVTDGDEVNAYGTDALNADSDGDGLTDGDEISVYGTLPLDSDSDDDTYSDGDEIAASTDPSNGLDYPVDQDGDGLSDQWESTHTCMDMNLDDQAQDYDGDGLDNLTEYGLLIDPCSNDSDGDLFTDGYEVEQGTSASDPLANPSLQVNLVAYVGVTGYGDSETTWLSSAPDYFARYGDGSFALDLEDDLWVEIYAHHGALGISYDENNYLGQLEITACGSSYVDYNPVSYSCSSIPYYSASSDPSLETTEVQTESELYSTVWSALSSTGYVFSDWRWFRPQLDATENLYLGYKLSLVP